VTSPSPFPGTNGRLLDLPACKVQVYEGGDPLGPSVVFLHGFLTSSYTWRQVVDHMPDTHRLVAVDLPGSGLSPEASAVQWDGNAICDLLDTVCDEMEIGSATFVGTQMGGSITALFSTRYPLRIERMAILAAGALGETSTNLTLYKLLAHPLVGSMLSRFFPKSLFVKRWKATHGPSHPPTEDELHYFLQHLRRRGQGMARLGLGIRLSYGDQFDKLVEPLRQVTVPTLLMFGDKDPLVPITTGHKFLEVLPNANLVTLVGCGDFPQEEMPGVVARELKSFLSAADTATEDRRS
jgi:pimeloyl-ACP methyl ester carboxylesterase